jgi:hypothetical protein
MVKAHSGERWKTIPFYKNAYGQSYAVSNLGRLACFNKDIQDGKILECSLQEGYPIWRYRRKKKNGTIAYEAYLIHRLVAMLFLPQPKPDKTVVIHLNHKKTDNRQTNLKWVTPDDAYAHQQHSPAVKKMKKLRRENPQQFNAKLTEAKVKQIKRLLAKNKTLKEIATAFDVSDMQVHRIKTGENWRHVKI